MIEGKAAVHFQPSARKATAANKLIMRSYKMTDSDLCFYLATGKSAAAAETHF